MISHLILNQFYGKNGNPLGFGETLIQNDLAESFQMVATQGPDAFYRGSLGEAIHSSMELSQGFLSIRDLESDKAEWWEPISIDFGEYKVYTASPPSTAFPSLIRLGLMEQINYEHNTAEYLQMFAEATKYAFWSRLAFAGDPEINPPPLEKLLSKQHLDSVRETFSMTAAKRFNYPGTESESKNTTHFVVADSWGNIVSATQTLGNLFGSRIMPEGTGIWLNNSLAYCTYEPKGNPMDAIPGQRKLSGDCPTIILKNQKPWAALGSPGGHTIGQNVPQIVLNLIKFDMTIKDAIAAPKITFVEPDWMYIESGISENVYQDLGSRGQNVRRIKRIGNAHGLRVYYNDNGEIDRYEGSADPRGSGLAKGY